MSIPTIPPSFDTYLKGFLHCLYQQGYDEYDAHKELEKLAGAEFYTEDMVKKFYNRLKKGNYLIDVRVYDVIDGDDEKKWWISKMASWAYKEVSGYLGYNTEGSTVTLLKPSERDEITIDNLQMIIGPDYYEVQLDETRRRYEKSDSDCIMTCGEDIQTIKNNKISTVAAEDLRELFQNPDLRIHNWKVAPVNGKEEPEFLTAQKEFLKMMDSILRSIEHYQKVESFHLSCQRVSHLKYFLPYFKPRILRKIQLNTQNQELESKDKAIFDLEQFKKAEEFFGGTMNICWSTVAGKFAHFNICSLGMLAPCDRRAHGDVVYKLLKNPKLEKMVIEIGNSPEDVGPCLEFFDIPGTPPDTLRVWKHFDYSGKKNHGKRLWCNIDKNRLVFIGPRNREPPMDCYV